MGFSLFQRPFCLSVHFGQSIVGLSFFSAVRRFLLVSAPSISILRNRHSPLNVKIMDLSLLLSHQMHSHWQKRLITPLPSGSNTLLWEQNVLFKHSSSVRSIKLANSYLKNVISVTEIYCKNKSNFFVQPWWLVGRASAS